jgi:hypothetical protein
MSRCKQQPLTPSDSSRPVPLAPAGRDEAAVSPEAIPSAQVAEDAVTYASWESFPASDPPGWRSAAD